jgi:hypothetical protein
LIHIFLVLLFRGLVNFASKLDSDLKNHLETSAIFKGVSKTIPMTTSEAERCFSTLKRIKTFLRSTMNSERLNVLAMLSIEKNFLSCHPEIKEKIIDLFAQIKTTRMDFIFKIFWSSTPTNFSYEPPLLINPVS